MQRNLKGREIYHTIRDAVIKYHGDYGIGVVMASLNVKYVNLQTNIVLVKAQRGAHQMVQSAMAFIKKIGNYDAFFRTLHIGGTIRTCQKFLINYNREQLPSMLRECKTEEERQEVKTAILGNTLVKEADNSDEANKHEMDGFS